MGLIAQSESLFTVSNGHIGLRGNLDEGDPHGVPGTYLNSFYELRALPYAEAGYGYPESGQTVVNVTNGKLIRLLVEDGPPAIRYGTLESHERVLDLRAGVLVRTLEWTSPAGKRIRLRSTRLVSFTQRAIAAIEYEVEAVDNDVRLIVQSELVANEALPKQKGDPRVAAVLKNPLVAQERSVSERGATLLHSTRESDLLVAAGMEHLVEGPGRGRGGTHRPEVWVRYHGGGDPQGRRDAARGQAARLRLVEPADRAGTARPGGGRADRRAGLRLRGADGGPARVPRRLLGRGRRRDRRGFGDPAGRALRHVPRPAGRCPRRTPLHRRQGANRSRVRRSHVLGHRGLRPAGPDP